MKNLNNLFRTIIAVVMMLIATLPSLAHDFEVDGIYYEYLDKSAKKVAITFGDNKYTGTITIPSSVTYSGISYSVAEIGDGAFYGCTGLTKVTIPNSVTEIGYGAFDGCTGLKSIIIQNPDVKIGGDAIPEGVKVIMEK